MKDPAEALLVALTARVAALEAALANGPAPAAQFTNGRGTVDHEAVN